MLEYEAIVFFRGVVITLEDTNYVSLLNRVKKLMSIDKSTYLYSVVELEDNDFSRESTFLYETVLRLNEYQETFLNIY